MVITLRGEPAGREARGAQNSAYRSPSISPQGGPPPCAAPPLISARDTRARFQGRFPQYGAAPGYDLVKKLAKVIDLPTPSWYSPRDLHFGGIVVNREESHPE